MLNKEEKRVFRNDLFRHLDGIVTAPVAFALHKKGLCDFLLKKKKVSISELSAAFDANEGYLNVALRVLCSQNWLDQSEENEEPVYSLNAQSELAFKHFHLYKEIVDLTIFSGQFHPRKFQAEPFERMVLVFENYQNNFGLVKSTDPLELSIQDQILKHIEGLLIGPTIVALGMGGMFHKYFMETFFRAEEFHKQGSKFDRLLNMLAWLGWFERKNETFRFTDKGLFFAKRASAYGVTVSYIPMFREMDNLLFGNANVLWERSENSPELHVDREMNVWGSGGAHSTYFKKIDEILISIFNRPIEEQPKGVVDMGCGNGAFLEHIFDVVEQRTLRGSLLEEHPLLLVGADFNNAALRVTRGNLIQADVWAKVIWGDIGRPDILARDLKEDYDIDLADLLNVRTFLDHNRMWSKPKEPNPNRVSESSGAFAYKGERLKNALVEDNLLEHFNKWSPYVKRFGLLVIELHTIAADITASNLGKTAATAYDATHGFSDQFILEVGIFNKIAGEAGLFPDPTYFSKFPDSELATVSINLLKGKEN